MATTIESVQQLYVAYFNRPAEPTGLNYWVNAIQNNGGTLTDVSRAFAATTEYQAQFANMSSDQIIVKIYDNLFNRLPDQSGLNYWSGNLQSGKLTINFIVDAIASSAVNNPTVSPADTAAINSKTQAAVKFTDLLNSDVNLRLAYGTPAAGEVAKAYIHGVTDAATLATAVAALPTTTAEALVLAGQPVGGTQTLTLGQDVLVGTSANDTFKTFVVNNTTGDVVNVLAAFDSIDGGAGNDTLDLAVSATSNNKLVGTVKNVEIINISGSNLLETGATGGTAGTIGADFFIGSNKITVDGNATTVTGVTNQKVVFGASVAGVANAVTYATSATAGSIGVNNTSGAITVTGAKVATLNVDGSTHITAGGAVAGDTLTLKDAAAAGASTITKLNLTLANDSKVDVSDLDKLTSIDATASKGGIELVGAAATVATLATGSGDDIVSLNTATTATIAASATTGAGDDIITVNTTGAGKVTVNAGAGDDTIVLSSALTSSHKIDGGEGKDTLKLAGGTLAEANYILIGAAVSNVEGLEFTGITSVDAARLSQFGTLEFDAAGTLKNVAANQALIAHANIDATAAGYAVAGDGTVTYAGSLNVTADTTGAALTLKADSATVNVTAGAADAAATPAVTGNVDASIVGDVKTLTVNVTNSVDAATPTVDTLASANIDVVSGTTKVLAGLTSITLTGNGSVDLDNSNATGSTANAATKLATIDASALGGTLTVGANAGNITGGLTFTGNVNVVESIKLGAGHDVLTIASTYEKMDTITGFDAVQEVSGGKATVDFITFGGKPVINGAGASTDITKMTLAAGDTSLALAFTHAATVSAANAGDIVQFVFEGNTYLFADVVGGTNTAGVLDATDAAVKLVGTIDLSTAFATAAAV